MVLKWNDIQKLGSDKFDEAEALEIKANKMLEDAQIAFEKAQQTLYDAKVEAKQLQKQASALYRESDQLYAQAEAMEHDKMMSDSSVHQLALRKAEAKMLGLRIDPASAGNAGGREDNRLADLMDKFLGIMNGALHDDPNDKEAIAVAKRLENQIITLERRIAKSRGEKPRNIDELVDVFG